MATKELNEQLELLQGTLDLLILQTLACGRAHGHAIARSIEQQTAKLPSDLFLWAALGSIAASLYCQVKGKEKTANFIGHWAPTILILGLYNKIVKLEGSDGR